MDPTVTPLTPPWQRESPASPGEDLVLASRNLWKGEDLCQDTTPYLEPGAGTPVCLEEDLTPVLTEQKIPLQEEDPP